MTSIRLHGLDWVDWVSFFVRAFNMFNTLGEEIVWLVWYTPLPTVGTVRGSECLTRSLKDSPMALPALSCASHNICLLSGGHHSGTLCKTLCKSIPSAKYDRWFVYCFFFCGVTLLRIVVPGLGNCQTTKKTRLRLIPNWNPNGPFFSRPRVEHLFSPSPVDVKWAPMSGTWVPGTWWNQRP